MIEKAVYTALSGSAALTAIVADRVSQERPPQPVVYPCVSFFRGGRTPSEETIASYCNDSVQVDGWAMTRAEAQQLEDAIFAALHAKPLTSTSRRIESCLWVDTSFFFEEDTRIHHVALDFNIRSFAV